MVSLVSLTSMILLVLGYKMCWIYTLEFLRTFEP
jgi:hypothetical protein